MGLDVGKFMKTPEYELKIITYRDIFQVEAQERDRFGKDYEKLSASIMMSKNDLAKMGLKPGDRVKVANNNGSVVVEARESKRDEPGGVAFMVNSPWSNVLVSDETGGRGIPDFKNITAKISLVKEEITSLESLMEYFRKCL
ncbi:MAG: molybdopterin dinucleotide binding domain-containing protein [Candidatus Methanoperedens sp.]|nr:molybdopterin dinucleotide binding domain-containing protein [Candidatus Methanoperedens sp.]